MVIFFIFCHWLVVGQVEEYFFHETIGKESRILFNGSTGVIFQGNADRFKAFTVEKIAKLHYPNSWENQGNYFFNVKKVRSSVQSAYFKVLDPHLSENMGDSWSIFKIGNPSKWENFILNNGLASDAVSDMGFHLGNTYVAQHHKLYLYRADEPELLIDSSATQKAFFNSSDSTIFLLLDGTIIQVDSSLQALDSLEGGILIHNYYSKELWVVRGDTLSVYDIDHLTPKRKVKIGNYQYTQAYRESHRMEVDSLDRLWYLSTDKKIIILDSHTGEETIILTSEDLLNLYHEEIILDDFSIISANEYMVSSTIYIMGKNHIYCQKRKIGETFQEKYIDIGLEDAKIVELSNNPGKSLFIGKISNFSEDTLYRFSIYDSPVYKFGRAYYDLEITKELTVYPGGHIEFIDTIFTTDIANGELISVTGANNRLDPDLNNNSLFTEVITSEKNETFRSFYLFPNPSGDKVYFSGPSLKWGNYGVYDLAGNEILRGSYDDNGIDVKELPFGLYLCQFQIGNEKYDFIFLKR